MTMTAERLRLLHGSAAPIAEMRPLRAGHMTMLLDGVDLRYLRLGDTELVRRVYVAVRDVDWDTVPGTVSGLEVEQADKSFRVDFDVRHARREIDFSWHGTITGEESGRVEVVLDGRAEDVLRTTGSGSASTIRGVRRRPLAFAPGPRSASSKGPSPTRSVRKGSWMARTVRSSPRSTGSRWSCHPVAGCCSNSRATCGRPRITATGPTPTSRRTRRRSRLARRRRSRPGSSYASASS